MSKDVDKAMDEVILPGEWEAQDAVQLIWPDDQTDWSYILDEVVSCYRFIAKEILKRQTLVIVTRCISDVASSFSADEKERIIFVETLINDTWARDSGGISVRFTDGTYSVCDFRFNGWGGKFEAGNDDLITRSLFESGVFRSTVRRKDCSDFILEGGAIESNGRGVLLTTSNCLLNKNRNPEFTKQEVEGQLERILGAQKILWLNHGFLQGDDTDAHVDTLARFCAEDTIVYVKCSDTEDTHYKALQRMEQELLDFRDNSGNSFSLIPLPMVPAIFDDMGSRLPATYANFLIINGAVLVPVYNVKTDEHALDILRGVFNDREVIGIDCSTLIKQHGSLHCITMQYPLGTINIKKKL